MGTEAFPILSTSDDLAVFSYEFLKFVRFTGSAFSLIDWMLEFL